MSEPNSIHTGGTQPIDSLLCHFSVSDKLSVAVCMQCGQDRRVHELHGCISASSLLGLLQFHFFRSWNL